MKAERPTIKPVEIAEVNGRTIAACGCGDLIEIVRPGDDEWFAGHHRHDGVEPPKPKGTR